MTGSLLADEHLIGTLRLELAFPDLDQTDRALPDADRLAGDVIVPVLEEVVRDYDGVNLSLDQLEIDLGPVTEDELPYALARALRDEMDRRLGPSFLPFFRDDPLIKVEVDAPSIPSIGDYTPSPVEDLVAFLTHLEVPWEEDVQAFDPVELFDRAMESLREPGEETASLEAFLSRLEPVPFVRMMELARRSERFPDLVEQLEQAAGVDAGMSPSSDEVHEGAQPQLKRASAVKAVLLRQLAARKSSWKAYRKEWREKPTLKEKEQDLPVAQVSSSAPPFYVPEALEEEIPAFLRGESLSEPGPEAEFQSPSSDVPEYERTEGVPMEAVPEDIPAVPETESPSSDVPEYERTEGVPMEAVPEDIPAVPETESPSPAVHGQERKAERQETETTASAVPPVPEKDLSNAPVSQSEGVLSAPSDSSPVEPLPDSGETPVSPETTWEVQPEEEDEFVPERMFLSDAGLVLIHPFIRRFFRNLELVDEKGRFVSRLARVHAVHLLRHLTGFEDEHLAHRLNLEKALCGLPFSYSIPEEWEATPREKEEAEGMLSALLSYWPSLRKTSVGAFQRGFLQRAGTIGMEDGSLIVRVEGSALDILMEELPWEISIILLPWLEKPILVEWQR